MKRGHANKARRLHDSRQVFRAALLEALNPEAADLSSERQTLIAAEMLTGTLDGALFRARLLDVIHAWSEQHDFISPGWSWSSHWKAWALYPIGSTSSSIIYAQMGSQGTTTVYVRNRHHEPEIRMVLPTCSEIHRAVWKEA